MELLIEKILQHTITFFAIIDPIGVSAIMLSLLSNHIVGVIFIALGIYLSIFYKRDI